MIRPTGFARSAGLRRGLLVLAAICLGGCQTGGALPIPALPNLPVFGSEGGSIKVESLFTDGGEASNSFQTVVYQFDSTSRVRVLMFDGPPERPDRAVAIQLLWRPIATRTPLDRSATNATFHYIVFEGAESAGVYSGAGFMFLKNKPGQSKLSAQVREAILRLADDTPAFDDNLLEARLTGKLIAVRDDAAVPRLMHQLNVQIADRLGYPRLVLDTPPALPTPLAHAAP